MKLLQLSLPILFLSSCTAVSGGLFPSSAPKQALQYEVVGVEEQALESLAQVPNQFVVPFQDDEHAWERAHLFFKSYTSGATEQNFDYPAAGVTLLSKQGAHDKYLYQVERTQKQQGFSYFVRCALNSSLGTAIADNSQRNAQNLARFIRDGRLELSLLDR